MMQSVNVVVVEPSRLFREGLRLLLSDPPHRICAAVATIPEAFDHGNMSSVQLILWGPGAQRRVEADLSWLAHRLDDLARQQPPMRHVLLTNAADIAFVRQIAWHRFDAVLSQDISAEVLQRSLELVVLGQQLYPAFLARHHDHPAAAPARPEPAAVTVLPPESQRHGHPVYGSQPKAELIPFRLPAGLRNSLPAPDWQRPVVLSEREGQTLQRLLDGASNKEIARRLGLTETTVKAHLKGLLRKLRVSNRTQAAIWARDNNEQVAQATRPMLSPAAL